MAGDDYYGGDYLQDRPLLDQVHNEAGRHVDGHNPWDGRGDEPAERVSAYCAVGWQVAEWIRAGRAVP